MIAARIRAGASGGPQAGGGDLSTKPSLAGQRRLATPSFIPMEKLADDDEDDEDWPPAWCQSANKNDLFVEAASKGKGGALRKMLREGQGVNAKHSVLGHTALIAAVDFCHLRAVDLLISHGANSNVANIATGECPLHRAAIGGRVDIIQRLLQGGALKSTKNEEQMTPVMIAMEYQWPEAARVLREPPARGYTLRTTGQEVTSVSFEWLAPAENGGTIDGTAERRLWCVGGDSSRRSAASVGAAYSYSRPGQPGCRFAPSFSREVFSSQGGMCGRTVCPPTCRVPGPSVVCWSSYHGTRVV